MKRDPALRPLSRDHLKALIAAFPVIEEALDPDSLSRLAAAIEEAEAEL